MGPKWSWLFCVWFPLSCRALSILGQRPGHGGVSGCLASSESVEMAGITPERDSGMLEADPLLDGTAAVCAWRSGVLCALFITQTKMPAASNPHPLS